MGKIAYVFAGQGAQYVGMGQSLYEASPAARAVLDRAEAIRPGTLQQCFEGPMEALSTTINTQPCLFAVDLACAAAADEAGYKADFAAGFSLGEVAAAAYCGYMDFDEAFRLVMKRAELMQAAADQNPGKMAAILRLTADQVIELASQFDGVYPVNFNCPGQTVVACKEASFDAFCAKVAELRGRAMPLKVSGAFHSPFMDAASEGLNAYLVGRGLAPAARVPLYANLTGEPYPNDWQSTLAAQVNHPVRWEQTVRNLAQAGATAFIEVGAGTTLSGLIKKTLEVTAAYNVQDTESLDALKAVGAI